MHCACRPAMSRIEHFGRRLQQGYRLEGRSCTDDAIGSCELQFARLEPEC
jgi:hypothetical protein